MCVCVGGGFYNAERNWPFSYFSFISDIFLFLFLVGRIKVEVPASNKNTSTSILRN